MDYQNRPDIIKRILEEGTWGWGEDATVLSLKMKEGPGDKECGNILPKSLQNNAALKTCFRLWSSETHKVIGLYDFNH